MRVLLRSPMGPFSGYGNDGLGMTRAMLEEGWDVRLQPHAIAPPLPADIALLLTKPVEPPLDLTIVHADPGALSLSPGAKRATGRAIAWTMWEWPSFSHEPKIERRLPGWLEHYDEVVAYDETSLEALRSVLGEDERLRKVQGGYTAKHWPPFRERNWDDPITRFGMVGALHNRKNPFAAIEAFSALREEKEGDFAAELHLKTVTRTLHPKIEERYPGVVVHYETWDAAMMYAFYTTLHCLVAPSRGEGKNLPALEAMSTGIPVAATRVGGHLEWLSSEYAYAIEGEERVDSSGKTSVEADVESLKEIMWRVHTERMEARRLGEVASRVIPQMKDWGTVLRRLVTA